MPFHLTHHTHVYCWDECTLTMTKKLTFSSFSIILERQKWQTRICQMSWTSVCNRNVGILKCGVQKLKPLAAVNRCYISNYNHLKCHLKWDMTVIAHTSLCVGVWNWTSRKDTQAQTHFLWIMKGQISIWMLWCDSPVILKNTLNTQTKQWSIDNTHTPFCIFPKYRKRNVLDRNWEHSLMNHIIGCSWF